MTHKYCCDCKYESRGETVQWSRCNHPSALKRSYLDPWLDERGRAQTMRENISKCGPDAKWFEAKEGQWNP